MQMLFEFFPVLLFFIAFKYYGIYVATIVGIYATALQVFGTRCVTKKWDRKQLITLSVFLIFGGMTLYFHNPIFVKWKPTIVFWLFAFAILITQAFTKKPLMQRMMEGALETTSPIPAVVWRNVNFLWAAFFIVMGGVNLYIAYHFSDDVWANFKLYGITGSLFLISIVQAAYLMKYITDKETTS